jgi:CheY-like chemotaxis protein
MPGQSGARYPKSLKQSQWVRLRRFSEGSRHERGGCCLFLAVSLPGAATSNTVLIVDDDVEIRHVLRLLCESESLRVVGEAANGVEAVPLALHHQPDFVILDYRLPRLDGEGAAEILRAITPKSKIVAFSAILDRQPEWADAYLNKERISELMPLLHALIR